MLHGRETGKSRQTGGRGKHTRHINRATVWEQESTEMNLPQ